MVVSDIHSSISVPIQSYNLKISQKIGPGTSIFWIFEEFLAFLKHFGSFERTFTHLHIIFKENATLWNKTFFRPIPALSSIISRVISQKRPNYCPKMSKISLFRNKTHSTRWIQWLQWRKHMRVRNYKQKPFIWDQSQLSSLIISRVIGQERSLYGRIMGEVRPNFDLVAKNS